MIVGDVALCGVLITECRNSHKHSQSLLTNTVWAFLLFTVESICFNLKKQTWCYFAENNINTGSPLFLLKGDASWNLLEAL